MLVLWCHELFVLETLDVAVQKLVRRKEHRIGDSRASCIHREPSIHVGFEKLYLWWLHGSASLGQAIHLVSRFGRVNWVDQSPANDTADTSSQRGSSSRQPRELAIELCRRLIRSEV